MGAMEKKRLLPALTVAALLLLGAAASLAEDSSSLQGIRSKPEEAELSRAKKFLGKLKKPDTAPSGKNALGDKKKFPRGGGTQRNNGTSFG